MIAKQTLEAKSAAAPIAIIYDVSVCNLISLIKLASKIYKLNSMKSHSGKAQFKQIHRHYGKKRII